MALESSEVDSSSTSSALAMDSAAAASASERLSAPLRGIRANALWMLVGNAAYAGARWLIVVIIAKLGTEEMVGQYGWALALCIPTITICRFGSRVLIATDTGNRFPLGDYTGFGLLGAIAGMLIVSGLVFAQSYDRNVIFLVLAVAAWNSIESISEVLIGFFQRCDRMNYIAISFIAQAIVICGLLTILLFVTHNLAISATALVFSAAARLCACEIPMSRRLLRSPGSLMRADVGSAKMATNSIRPQFEWQPIGRLLLQGTPMGVAQFLLAFTTNLPRFILHDYLGDAQLGIFVALFFLAFAQAMIVNAVMQSLWSRMALLYANHDRSSFIRLMVHSIWFGLGTGLLGVAVALVIGKPILALVFKPEYAVYNKVFIILLLAAAIENLASVFGTMANAMRKFTSQVFIQLIKLAVTYFGCIWAVRVGGLPGVAMMLVGAAGVSTLCYGVLCFWGMRALRDTR